MVLMRRSAGVLLQMMGFRQFSLDAVFTENVVPCRASLHLRVVVTEYLWNAMLPDEVLESGGAFTFSPHAINRGKMTGLSHKELRTGNAAQARGRTEQRVCGKGFGKQSETCVEVAVT